MLWPTELNLLKLLFRTFRSQNAVQNTTDRNKMFHSKYMLFLTVILNELGAGEEVESSSRGYEPRGLPLPPPRNIIFSLFL